MKAIEGWFVKYAPTWCVKFDPSGPHKITLPAGVRGNPHPNADNWNYEGCAFFCETKEGPLHVKPGSWIATGINGEHWPIADEIFQKTYKPQDYSATPKRVMKVEIIGSNPCWSWIAPSLGFMSSRPVKAFKDEAIADARRVASELGMELEVDNA